VAIKIFRKSAYKTLGKFNSRELKTIDKYIQTIYSNVNKNEILLLKNKNNIVHVIGKKSIELTSFYISEISFI
jgi:hypothetical protein